MADVPQRRVIHMVDAVVAGQGDGPLAPQPLALGLLLAGGSAAAVDWVGAELLRYDPALISISREAFGSFRWPLTAFGADAVSLLGDAPVLPAGYGVDHPLGWRDAAAGAHSRGGGPSG